MVDEIKEPVKEPDMIERANQAAERLEAANKIQAELLKKMEALESRNILGGKSAAGQNAPPVEETPSEYAKRILRGGK